MDGVSWSTTRAQESFSPSRTPADTLSRLASFITRADTKQHARSQRQQQQQQQQPPLSPSHLHTYACQECGKGFLYATELLNHQEVKHALPKPHRCPSCGQEFSLRSSLQLHKCDYGFQACEVCRGEPRLGSPCPVCTADALDPDRPRDASPRLVDGSPYACALCGRGFSQKQALLHHQQAACSEPPSPSGAVDPCGPPDDSPPASEGDSARSDSPDTPGPSCRAGNVCQFCFRTFRTEAALQRHEQTNHAEEQGQNAKEEGNVRDVRKGGDTKTNGDPNKSPKTKMVLLSCRSCDMVFRSTSKLYMHRKEKHSREKNAMRDSRPVVCKRRRGGPYPCQICGKLFVHHLSLRAHYRRHTSAAFATIKNNSQSLGSATKDSKLLETRPNEANASLGKNKTVRAGPGRPRKVPRIKNRVSGTGKCREVPQVEEEEVEREFPCPSCAEVFSVQSQLREHVELHQSSVRQRQCSVCSHEMDTCKWPGSKRQRLYHCVPCQQGFSALDSFLDHCQEHLRARVEEDCITEGYAVQAGKA